MEELKLELEQTRQNQRSSIPDVRFPTVVPEADTQARPVPGSSPMEAATVETVASDPQEMVKSMGLVLLESSNQPRFMGTSSGITFAKMVLASIKEDVPIDTAQSSKLPTRHDSSVAYVASSLPPRHAAEHIAVVYLSYRTPHVPVLERSKVNEVIDTVYTLLESDNNLADLPDMHLFVAYMVFAVGLHGMPMAGGVPPPQSEGCFNSALQCVDGLLAYSPSDLETLTVVLLLAQYIALNPSRGSLWQLTGMALRLCVDLGLHWETNAVLALPQQLLNERRRLYWATYRFDRFLCISLGRPFGIAEQSMNTGLPDPYAYQMEAEIQGQRFSNHIVKLYRLRSEIKYVLYHQLQGPTLAYPRANYSLWFRDIQSRLRTWHDEVPAHTGVDQESMYAQRSWWEAHYCNAQLMLHRPNPLVPLPTRDSLQTCFDSARRSIQAIKTLQREGRMSIVWAWVHHLFLSGLAMIYCIWQSAEIRTAACIMDVMAATQDCTSTLSVLAERFNDAKGCRDAFESLSSATLKWLVGRDRQGEIQGQRPVLADEMDALRELVPFAKTGWQVDEPASIFPEEPFEFAQYLSAAAQWQDSDTGGILGSF